MNLHDIYLAAQLAGKNYAHINDTINAAQDKIAENACTLGYTRKNTRQLMLMCAHLTSGRVMRSRLPLIP